MREWWFNDSGLNMLKGVHGDEENPILLPDETIANFLANPYARASFDRLFPTMLPEEQARLEMIIEGSVKLIPLDIQEIEDNFQHQWNVKSIRTAGTTGGGSWAPPPFGG